MVIYGDIVINFLRILSTKSTIYHKLKIRKLFFSLVSEYCTSFGEKIDTFSDILVYFLSVLSTKSTISQQIKIGKLLFFIDFRTLRIFLDQKPNLATFEGDQFVVN